MGSFLLRLKNSVQQYKVFFCDPYGFLCLYNFSITGFYKVYGLTLRAPRNSYGRVVGEPDIFLLPMNNIEIMNFNMCNSSRTTYQLFES